MDTWYLIPAARVPREYLSMAWFRTAGILPALPASTAVKNTAGPISSHVRACCAPVSALHAATSLATCRAET